MAIKEDLAATIRAQRLAKGLSQDKLAAKAELSTRHIQSIESGEKQPTVDTIFKLARALDEDFTALLNPVWAQWVKNK